MIRRGESGVWKPWQRDQTSEMPSQTISHSVRSLLYFEAQITGFHLSQTELVWPAFRMKTHPDVPKPPWLSPAQTASRD